MTMKEMYENKFGGRFFYRGKVYDPHTYDPVYHLLDRYTGTIITIVVFTTWKIAIGEVAVIDKKLSEIISNERNIKMDYIINKSI